MAKARAMTWWIAIPLGLLLLVVLSLLLVDLFDRRLLGERIASLVEERTGRSLTMDRVDLRWRWPVALEFGNVSLANAEWGSETALLRARAATLLVDPLELLDGPPYGQLHLQDPQVQLERSREGEWNWQLKPDPQSPRQPSELPLAIEADGGRIVYEDADRLAVDLRRFSLSPTENAEGAQAFELELRATSEGMPLEIDGTLTRTATEWEGSAGLRVGDSTLDAQFTADAGTDPLRVRASVDSSLLAPFRLARLQPAKRKSAGPQTMQLPRLDGLDARLDVAVDRLRLPKLAVEDIRGRVRVHEGRIAVDDLAARAGSLSLKASAALDTTAGEPVLRVTAAVGRASLAAAPDALPLSGGPGEVALQGEARLVMPDRQFPLTPAALLSRLAIPRSRFVYARSGNGESVEVIARLRVEPAGGEPSVALQLQGIEAPPFDAVLSAPPLRELTGGATYPVELAISTDGAQARLRAQLGEVLRASGIDVAFSFSGNELPAVPALGLVPPPVPAFGGSGRLHADAGRWAARDLEFRYGESRLRGSAIYSTRGERPQLGLQAEASLLDLTAIPETGNGESGGPGGPPGGWIPDNLPRALRQMDAEVELRAERVRITNAQSLHSAHVRALLQRGRLRVEPLAFGVAGGSIDGSLTARAATSPVAGQLTLDVENLKLSRFADFFDGIEDHLGRLSGRLDLSAAEKSAGEDAKDLVLPTVGRISIGETRLRFRGTTDSDLDLEISTRDPAEAEREQELIIRADGRYRGEPVRLDLRGGSLLALRNRQTPYELRVETELGGASASLEGRVLQPWSPESARFDVSVDADSTELLETLLEPLYSMSLPSFDVDGTFVYEGRDISFRDFDVRFGQSDLRGDIAVELSGETPAVTARLRSDKLDLSELASLTDDGREARANGPAKSPANGRLLPQTEFNVAALSRANVDIELNAGNVDAAAVPLGGLTADLRLQDGRLLAEPVRVETDTGRVELRVDLTTRRSLLEGMIDVEARGLNLGAMLQEVPLAADSFGIVGGQARFWAAGDSVAALAESADGGVMLLMTEGALDSLLVETAGLDLAEAAFDATGLSDRTPIDCAYASFHASDGVISVDRFVIDTADTTFFVDGSANLGRETLDLTLYPEAKDFSLLAADTPIGITGTLQQPQVDVLTGDLAAQPAAALALTGLAAPIAAILPFVEPGLQEEPSICKGWVERLQGERADDS